DERRCSAFKQSRRLFIRDAAARAVSGARARNACAWGDRGGARDPPRGDGDVVSRRRLRRTRRRLGLPLRLRHVGREVMTDARAPFVYRAGLGSAIGAVDADPVTTEVIRHGLNAAAERMKRALVRMS